MKKEIIKIQKIGYNSFRRAVEGDLDEVRNIIQIYQKQRMIILSQAPNCSSVRNEICNTVKQLKILHVQQDNKYFSVGTNFQEGVISHMNNYFFNQNTIQIAQSLGFDQKDSPDLLAQSKNPEIINFNLIEKNFINFSYPIFLGFFKIVDRYFQSIPTISPLSKHQILGSKSSIEQLARNSELQNYRNIFQIPLEKIEKEEQQQQLKQILLVPWNLDLCIASIILKEMYLIKDKQSLYGYKEIPQPNCGAGLIIRDANGSDHLIEIEEDELIIQGGISLQFLTNDSLKAQVYCVRQPKNPNIGSIYNTTLFYPPFNTRMEINNDLKTIEIQQTDMNVLDPITKFSNHWRQGVNWIKFHHNQMLLLLLKAYLNEYKNKNNINDDINLTYHTFQVPQGEVKAYQFSQLDSTMEPAKFWYKHYVSYKCSFAFIADQQLSGKGQNQNTWLSPKGNCYVTYLVQFPSELSYCIPQLAALSVVETIQEMSQKIGKDIKPVLKWINDIHINDKKIAGVLCTTEGDYLQIGVGVNLNQNPNLDIATNLKEELKLNQNINVIDFISSLTFNLMNNLENVKKSQNYKMIISKVMKNLKYLGEDVIIYDETLTKVLNEGVFIGINEYGNAILKQNNDQEISIIHGRMRNKKR